MQDGFLTISVINASTNRPIPNATINIYGMNDQQENTGIVLQNLITDESGQVRNLTLSSYVIAVFITLGFTMLINLTMRHVLNKVDMVESLKSIE